MGEKAFEAHSKYEELKDIDIPDCFLWVFDVFLDLHYCSHDFISYPDISAWEQVYNERLSIFHVHLIRKMSSWAADENRKAREGDE